MTNKKLKLKHYQALRQPDRPAVGKVRERKATMGEFQLAHLSHSVHAG